MIQRLAPRQARPRRCQVSSRGARPIARGANAIGKGARSGRLGHVRLREHDLQLRGRLRGDRAVAHRHAPVRREERQLPAEPRDRRERRPQRHRLADPRRALGSRRAAAAVPARLHGTVHRRHGVHRGRRRHGRARPVHRRQLRLPSLADLLRRDPQDGQQAREPRHAVGDRGGRGVSRDDRRRPRDLLPRHPGRGPVPAVGGDVRALRDPDLHLRQGGAVDGRDLAGATSPARSGRSSTPSSTPAACPASGGSCSAGSSTRMR